MEKCINSGLFPVVALIEGDLFRVLNNASVRSSILSLEPLFDGCQFTKSRRDESNDDSRHHVPDKDASRAVPSDELGQFSGEENHVKGGL